MTYPYFKEIEEQNKYCNLSKWHDAGFKGQGFVVWNTESDGNKSNGYHGEITARRIYDSAPNATILHDYSLSLDSSHNIAQVEKDVVITNLEDFIKDNKIDIITRSIGGNTTKEGWDSQLWDNLKKKYNITFFTSAGNKGVNGIGGAIPPDIANLTGALTLVKGNPKRANYSSVGEDIDFSTFVGIWSGTSFASPYLAGMCATIQSRYGKMSHEELTKYLIMICMDLETKGFDNYTGYGLPILPELNRKYITMTTKSNKYYIDGTEHAMDTTPINNNGTIYCPVRFIAESLGYKVDFKGNKDKSITITMTKDTNQIILTTNSEKLYVNGKEIIMKDVKGNIQKPYIDSNGRTLVPIRQLTTAFGCLVDWIQKENKVMILEGDN